MDRVCVLTKQRLHFPRGCARGALGSEPRRLVDAFKQALMNYLLFHVILAFATTFRLFNRCGQPRFSALIVPRLASDKVSHGFGILVFWHRSYVGTHNLTPTRGVQRRLFLGA